jgi:hypothetical protein
MHQAVAHETGYDPVEGCLGDEVPSDGQAQGMALRRRQAAKQRTPMSAVRPGKGRLARNGDGGGDAA